MRKNRNGPNILSFHGPTFLFVSFAIQLPPNHFQIFSNDMSNVLLPMISTLTTSTKIRLLITIVLHLCPFFLIFCLFFPFLGIHYPPFSPHPVNVSLRTDLIWLYTVYSVSHTCPAQLVCPNTVLNSFVYFSLTFMSAFHAVDFCRHSLQRFCFAAEYPVVQVLFNFFFNELIWHTYQKIN